MLHILQKKNTQPTPHNQLPQVSTYPYYFIATIDGQELRFEGGLGSGEYRAGPASISSSLNQYTDWYEGCRWERNSNSSSPSTFYVYILHSKANSEYPGFAYTMNLLQKKKYSFGMGKRSPETKEGIVIRCRDNNGQLWQSDIGSQDGSSFEVVELTEELSSAKSFRAHFNCKLYTALQSKTLSNGTARDWFSPEKD